MENKYDTAKLAADIEVLKFQIQCLQKENDRLMAHIGKTAERLAGAIDTTNTRIEKAHDRMDKILACVKDVSQDLARDGRVTLNHLMRLDATVEQLQAILMPSVAAFENDVANIIGAPSYDARERQ